MYRCEATTIEGFIQQLAVCYVGKGYLFYVAGSIPEGKDTRGVDEKLIEKYGVNISKWTRARRKRLGFANMQYLRFDRFFILIASKGQHRFFEEELQVRDVRREPIRFAGYSVSFRQGSDGTWHPSVRIEALEFKRLKRQFLAIALRVSPEVLTARFSALHFVPYAPVRCQYRVLLRSINEKRRVAALETLPWEVLRWRRCSISPFR